MIIGSYKEELEGDEMVFLLNVLMLGQEMWCDNNFECGPSFAQQTR